MKKCILTKKNTILEFLKNWICAVHVQVFWKRNNYVKIPFLNPGLRLCVHLLGPSTHFLRWHILMVPTFRCMLRETGEREDSKTFRHQLWINCQHWWFGNLKIRLGGKCWNDFVKVILSRFWVVYLKAEYIGSVFLTLLAGDQWWPRTSSYDTKAATKNKA